MSKYFDRLVKIGESLGCFDETMTISRSSIEFDRNFDAAIDKFGREMSDADALVYAFNIEMRNNPEFSNKSIDDISLAEYSKWLLDSPKSSHWMEVATESDDENTILVPTDSLTDDQKKEILINDKEIDKKVVDGMSPEEMNGALKATDDEQQNESSEDIKPVVIRMDDDDLNMHGYVQSKDNIKELHLTEEIDVAARYSSMEDAKIAIDEFCKTFNYDPTTFKIEEVEENIDSNVANDEDVNIDDGETWISLDPMHPGATTIP